ncbi:MAG: hypothetical protein R3F62_00130 [Planctomycetota bacterium]
MPAGRLETRCNRCGYSRSFSLDLGGRYYRCPKCEQGVLAVPRPSAEDATTWRDAQQSWIRESAQRLGVEVDAQPAEDEVSDPDAVEPLDPAEAPNNRGQAASVRKLLVECALCDFLVVIPTEFFGKTVQCRNCAGNIVFTESTLEPIKDELLDRLLLESRERDLLERPSDAEPPPAWRSLALGLALGAGIVLLLGLIVAFVRG